MKWPDKPIVPGKGISITPVKVAGPYVNLLFIRFCISGKKGAVDSFPVSYVFSPLDQIIHPIIRAIAKR